MLSINLVKTVFQSTPSVGRATTLQFQANRKSQFQSTPSVGRATLVNLPWPAVRAVFQSTPSVGRATRPSRGAIFRSKRISIHALRGEGDGAWHDKTIRRNDFNPRPPWGGRLGKNMALGVGVGFISIHALRGEGDIVDRFGLCVITRFQSTPSVGRATFPVRNRKKIRRISIHALRGEGDTKLT